LFEGLEQLDPGFNAARKHMRKTLRAPSARGPRVFFMFGASPGVGMRVLLSQGDEVAIVGDDPAWNMRFDAVVFNAYADRIIETELTWKALREALALYRDIQTRVSDGAKKLAKLCAATPSLAALLRDWPPLGSDMDRALALFGAPDLDVGDNTQPEEKDR